MSSSSVGNGGLFFAVLADPQLGMTSGEDGVVCWDAELGSLNAAIDAINALSPRPSFCSVLGDLVHHFDRQTDGTFVEEVKSFKAAIARVDLSIPVYIIPGNHDVGDSPTSESLAMYREQFGNDFYMIRVSPFCRLLALNSGLFADSSNAAADAAEQLKWLEEALGSGRESETTIVLQHHLLFIEDEYETAESLAVAKSQSHFNGSIMSNRYFHIPRPMREMLLSRLRSSKSRVGAVLTGHFHQNWERRTQDGRILQLTTAAISGLLGAVDAETGACMPPTDKPGLRIVRIFPPANAGGDALLTSHYYSASGAAEAWRKLEPGFATPRREVSDEWW
jgi:serine/threonine-protein phosphatase CPPED1